MSDTADVSDLFDGFHRLASVLWREFGQASAADEEAEGVPFDELVDQLEVDVFLPACARRLRELLGLNVDPDDVAAHIRLHAGDAPIPGAAGRYHSHAFHPESLEGDVPTAVLPADLMPRDRAGVRLVLEREGRVSGSARRVGLPLQ